MSSWVHKVRHIQDVAPWLQPLPRFGHERAVLRRIDERNDAKFLAMLRQEPTYVEKAHRLYFQSFCHDSYALDMRKRGGKLVISLNSDKTIQFAWHIDQMFATSFQDGPWPIHLVSHDVADFRIVNLDRQGRLRSVPLPANLPFREQAEIRPWHPEYVHDFGWKVGQRIAWVVELWHLGWLLVDCGRLTARDDARLRIAQVYGPTIGGIYDELLGRRRCPVPLPNPDHHWRCIDKFLEQRFATLDVSLEQIAEEIWERKRVRG